MSRFFDELEARLRASAAERHAPCARAERRDAAAGAGADAGAEADAGAGTGRDGAERRLRRRRRPRRSRGLIAVAAVVALAAGGSAVGAVTGLWRPDVERQAPWGTGTVATVVALDCRTPSQGLRAGPPIGPEFADAFAVFGRPRTAADRVERKYLRSIGLIGVDLNGIRRVGVAADGTPHFLVPAQGLGRPAPPERCLRTLPPEQRRAYEAMRPRMEPSICWMSRGGGCDSLRELARRGTFGSSGVVRGEATITGLAPNGVRAVRVSYGRSTRTFPVRDNFFSFALGLDVEQASSPDRIEWLMEDGSVRDVTR